jgi:hypothetical protein
MWFNEILAQNGDNHARFREGSSCLGASKRSMKTALVVPSPPAVLKDVAVNPVRTYRLSTAKGNEASVSTLFQGTATAAQSAPKARNVVLVHGLILEAAGQQAS